jgi:predicted DNA-binding transcriptional regulator AlpA
MTNAIINGLFNVKRTRQFAGEIGTATLYKWMSEGSFPKPIRIGANRVAWRLSDLEAWRDSRPTAQYRSREAA